MSSLMARLVLLLALLASPALPGGVRSFSQGSARAGELTREELARKVSPPFRLGERDVRLPVYPVFRNVGGQDRISGYLFESIDFAPIPGFSGTPPNMLIALDSDGVFRSVSVVSQQEPVFVHGLGEEPLHRFVEQYAGKTVGTRGVKVGSPRASGTVRDGTNTTIDGVAKATVSVRIINESVLGAALSVARATLGASPLPPRATATPKSDFTPMTFAEMEKAGLIHSIRLSERDIEKGFAGTPVEGLDPETLKAPDSSFAEISLAYLNIPSVGRNLLGEANWTSVMEKLDAGHGVLVMVGGRYRPFDEPYVLGGTPDNLALYQNGLSIDVKDLFYDKPLALPDAPRVPFAILSIFARAGFDPAGPWRFSLRVTREKGLILTERVNADFSTEVKLPESRFDQPRVERERASGWQGMWNDRAMDLAVLGLGLALLFAVLIAQPRSMRFARAFAVFRLGFMVFTLVLIGWVYQAQLSIVTLAGLVKAVLVTHDFTFLLWDAPSLVLWGVAMVTAVIWGRGTFCGWLCPFGALQEVAATLASRLNLKQWRVPEAWDLRLRQVKYHVLAGFILVTALAPTQAEIAAEVEPFKTAITMVFQRGGIALAYVVALLLINLFVYKAFCRYLCPLGAFMALLGRLRGFNWIVRRVECGSPCRLCERKCRYGAIARSGVVTYDECFQCMDCVVIHEDATICVPLVLANRTSCRVKVAS